MLLQIKSVFFVASIYLLGLPVGAQPLQFLLKDQHGEVLEDAVVELLPTAGVIPPASDVPVMVAQRDLMFVPFVTAIQRGTAIEFPNQDKTRHHVYSFSPAKVFELKLYSGKPERPVVFDKVGVVALGCNIHDYMQAFVYVGESPYLAVSDSQGKASFAEAPAGPVHIKLWHPWQQQDMTPLELSLSGSQPLVLTLAVERQQKPEKPKKGFGQSYN